MKTKSLKGRKFMILFYFMNLDWEETLWMVRWFCSNVVCLASQFKWIWISLTWRHRRQNSLPHLSCGISSLSDFSSRQIQHVPLKRYTFNSDARVLCPAWVFGVLVLGLASRLIWRLFTGDLPTAAGSVWSSSSADMNSEVLAASGE